MTVSDRVRVKNVHVLSDRHYRLEEVEFDYRHGNGEWQTQTREVFERGHAVTLLPYNVASRTRGADAAVPAARLSHRP